jgi:N-acetylneuraminic acid mutarotase
MTRTVRSVGKNSASRAISTIRHLLLWSVWATLAALALPSAAPAAGFSSAAPMSGARYLATATLLPNGKVLVAGGQGSTGYLTSAELYDPSTNSWSAAGTLDAARASAVALLLPNGKVLVAGGYGATGAVASAELYDPATNSWSSGGTFVDARAYATATLLHNGRVLVAGGQGSAGDLASAELYDPATNTWSLAGTLGIARRGATASLLADGTVLVAGGVGVGGYLASAELYDPALNTWSSTGALGSARTAATATALPNGRVLTVGGESTGGTIAGVEIYDPVSRVWSVAAGSVVSRTSASATLLPDGKVLVSGGYGSSGDLVSAEIYDPATSVWNTAGSLVSARRLATATLLPSGKVLVAGGFSGSSALASAELFESSSPSWNSAGSLAPGRQFHAASLLPSGKLLVTGGFDAAYNILTSAQIYDPSVNSWSAGAPLLYPRAYHTATLTSSNRLLVVGGPGSLTAETYDFSSNTWSAAGTLAVERYQHTATLLPSGKVLVAGGQGTSFSILSSAELFTPSSNTWANAASLATARRYHTATLLPNGKLLVAGGIDSLGATLAGTEVYDPANNTWSPAAPMTAARYQHTATLLASGGVLVAGGLTANRASAELYDPSTDTWTPVASMANGRFLHVAALLASGNVLVAGGRGFSGTGAEVYDPTRNTWTAAGNLAEGRYHHTATLLATGRVVVVGGQNSAGTALLAAAEAFDIGLGFADSRRPVLTVVTDPVIIGTPVELDGIGFAGDSEASSGTTGSSPTNYPLVQFHRLDNNRLSWLSPDPSNPFSGTNWISVNAIGLTPGPHAMTMFVNGIPSIADVVDIIVSSIAPSTTTIASGVNPSVAGQGVTFTGTVVGSSPTGFVSFKNGVTTIGGCGSVPLSGGQALCVTNALAIGAHSITAEYSGDSNNAASSSGVIVQIVNDASVATSIAVVDGTPQTAPRGTVVAQPLRAIVRNSANVPIAGISVLFTFPSSGPSAGLFPTMVDMVNVTTDANGVATLSLAIANVLVGSYVVTATTGGVAAPANFNLTNSPGGAASFSALPNADRTVIVGATIAPPLQVMVRDAVGDPVVGAYVRFQLNTGVTGATGTFPVGQAYAPDVLSQSDGVATAPAILANGVVGVWTAGAGDPFGMVPDYVTFSVTNDAIATQTSVAFISGSPQSTVVGTAFAIPLRIKVTDAGGAGVAGVAVTVTAPASGASATLNQLAPNTDANGEVVVNATANSNAGAYSITATASGVAQPASGYLLNTLGNAGSIEAGSQHTCALTAAGGVKCWGNNDQGQLGDNSTTQRNAPVDVAGLSSGVVAVAAGDVHTCALTTAGGVKCWGYNGSGQLGDNSTTPRSAPVDVVGLSSGVVAVAAGGIHSCALTTAGGVKCWGYNGSGQLGDNSTTQRNAPVDVAGFSSGAVAVAAGDHYTCARTAAGGVKCWGNNTSGQLGDGTLLASPVPVFVSGFPGSPASITPTGGDLQSASINTNFAQKLQATVLDSSSAPVAGVQVTFNLPASGASGTFNTAGNPTQAVVNADATGVALSPWFVTANSVVGNWQASATIGALPAAIFNLTNASGAPASIVANSGTPQTTFTSTLFGEVLQATVKDSLGNPVVGATVTFKTPTTGASATFPGALRTVTAVTDAGGMASSPALTANGTAGTFNATAQVGALTANYSLTSILRTGSTIAPSTGTPQTTIVSTPYGAQLVAVVKDAGNNPVPGITVTFTLPGGTGASGTFATGGLTRVEITNASGIVTSPVITANTKKGAIVATARATGLAVPASFSLTNVPDVPATVTARVGAQTATVYLDFARALSVQVKDQFGNTIPGVNVAFALPAGPATAGFAPNGAGGQSMNVPTDVNGIATTSLLTANDTVGTYQATATAGAAPPATFALTNRIVSTATATILGGAGQSVVVGLPFAQPLSLIVKDSTGRTVEGVKVTFTLPAGTLSGTFPGATPTTLVTYTNGSGVATSDIVTAKTRSGTFNARATLAGLAGSTNFALTVLPDVPFRATALVGAQSVAAGSAFARAPSLYVTDQYNNRVPGVPVSFALPATGPSGVFGAPVNGIAAPVTTDANGVATSPLVTANLFVGAHQAVATISGLPNVTFNLTNTVGAGATIVSDGGSPQTTAINTQFALPLQAWVRNAGGFDLQGLNVTFTVATTRASFVGSATPGRVVVPTLANGRASTPPVLATGIRASYNATATAAGVTGSVTFALTNN